MSRFSRGAALAVLAALAAAPAASAGYPAAFAMQGGLGVQAKGVTFVALRLGGDTRLVASGAKRLETTVPGRFGIPYLRDTQPGLGMFRSGDRFVLQSIFDGEGATTTFQVVRTADLGLAQTIALRGIFSFDALSPDGRKLYLTQHTSTARLDEYVVRAYDLRTNRLLPGRIADKTQKGWVMHGWPAARAVSRDGRWVYTLYGNPSGFPFVHALDTVKGRAHCIGIAWRGSDQGVLMHFSLRLTRGELLVRDESGRLYRAIDRTTYAVRKR